MARQPLGPMGYMGDHSVRAAALCAGDRGADEPHTIEERGCGRVTTGGPAKMSKRAGPHCGRGARGGPCGDRLVIPAAERRWGIMSSAEARGATATPSLRGGSIPASELALDDALHGGCREPGRRLRPRCRSARERRCPCSSVRVEGSSQPQRSYRPLVRLPGSMVSGDVAHRTSGGDERPRRVTDCGLRCSRGHPLCQNAAAMLRRTARIRSCCTTDVPWSAALRAAQCGLPPFRG